MVPVRADNTGIWRRAKAGRATVLNDASAYFGALRHALLAARDTVFIVGWDIHSRTKLVGPSGHADDGWPECLGDFLRALVEQRPALRIHILIWNSPVLYAGEREWFPCRRFTSQHPDRLTIRLDDSMPVGSAQHQKIVVIDDRIAFSGGLDLTIRRWDTPSHAARQPDRVDPVGKPYPPFHDVQIVVDGEAVLGLSEIVRQRWGSAAKNLPPIRMDETGLKAAEDSSCDYWPSGLAVDFSDITVAIARTEPGIPGRPGINEVETSLLHAIDSAEHQIYIENQFLSALQVADRLVKRMIERPGLEVLMIAPKAHTSWFEARTMRNGRLAFMKTFSDAGVQDRVRLLYPRVVDGKCEAAVMIHSKVIVVDDRILRVGSANLNNRSMGADTECDLIIEADDDKVSSTIVQIRNRLLAHHCGVGVEVVEQKLRDEASLLRLADSLASGGHCLRPVDDGIPDPPDIAGMVTPIADPHHPLGVERVTRAMVRRSRFRVIAIIAVALLVLALVWRFTPLYEYTDFQSLRMLMSSLANMRTAPLIVIAIFVLGGLVMFPVVALIAATAAALGPWLGFGSAIAGVLASASLLYGIGRLVGLKTLRSMLGPRIAKIQGKIVGNGIVTVALLRMVPVAPFSLVNAAAGASGIRFSDFLIGTVLGMTPGIIAMSAFGSQLGNLFDNPTWLGIGVVAISLAAWLALSFAAQLVVTWFAGRRSRRHARKSHA